MSIRRLPTGRASKRRAHPGGRRCPTCGHGRAFACPASPPGRATRRRQRRFGPALRCCSRPGSAGGCTCSAACSRSEEHTSELQSQSNLVCRLLLEKKKKKKK